MVLSSSGGKSPRTSVSRPGTRHWVSRGLDAVAKGCPVSEKEGSSSEGFAREGLSRGAWVPGTKSGWANRAQLAGPAPRPPWLCTRSVQVGSLGEMHICEGPGGSCAPVHLYWLFPRTGSKTTGSERFLVRRTGLPEPRRTLPKSAGPPGGGVATLPAAQLMRARRPHGWAHPGHERHEETSDASDSEVRDGGRVATCDVNADHPDGWCTQWSPCCPCGPAYACPVTALSGGPEQGVLLATWGSWCASAVGGLVHTPDNACPLYVAPQPVAEASVKTTACPDTYSRGTPAQRNKESDHGLKAWRHTGVIATRYVPRCHAHLGTRPWSQCWTTTNKQQAVSCEANRAGLLTLRLPYAPGATEKVSVGPLSCPWMYSGSSTPTEHVPLWGVLTVRPNPTPYRENR